MQTHEVNNTNNKNVNANDGDQPITSAAPRKALVAIFSGALIRYPDGWYWKDGEPAPKVFDELREQRYDFAVQRVPGVGRCVAVPQFEVENSHELAWVAEGKYQVGLCDHATSLWRYREQYPGKPTRSVMTFLVPLADWRNWGKEIVGACWIASLEEQIIQKARSLGVRLEKVPPPAVPPARKTSKTASESLRLADIQLIADAMNGVNMILRFNPEESDFGDCCLIPNVMDAIALDRLDEKWAVDGKALVEKLQDMPLEARRILVFGIAEFWDRVSDEVEDPDLVLERLVLQLQQAQKPLRGVEGAPPKEGAGMRKSGGPVTN